VNAKLDEVLGRVCNGEHSAIRDCCQEMTQSLTL